MSATENLKNTFVRLVEAYEDDDYETKESLVQAIKNSGKSFNIKFQDLLQWEESQVKGYQECPIVIQSIEVFLGDELVYECERWFGSELVDQTHTGLGGRWETIRIDDGGHEGLIELLNVLDHSLEAPNVPEWR